MNVIEEVIMFSVGVMTLVNVILVAVNVKLTTEILKNHIQVLKK